MTEAILRKRFETTYKKQRNTLLNYIRSKVSNFEEAEDILQDVFYQALRSSNTTEPINNIMGWLYSIAKNKIIDWYRKKKNKTLSLHEKIDDDLTLEDLLADSGIHVEQEFLRSLVLDAIYKSIDELPAKQRDVFIKREFKSMSYKEISEKTGIPINTLLSQKRYANLFLQKRLFAIKETLEEF